MRGAVAGLALILSACTTTPLPPPPPHGVRVAVAFTLTGESGASAEGVADPASGRLATPDDPVRVASISKLVVGLGVMRLVEAGQLDLDRPVGDYLGYSVVNPAFPAEPVTLRRLLSHTSSLRDHDDQYAIPLGQTVRAVLEDAASWDPAHGPSAAYFTYGNVNFPVVGSIIERATGERFDGAMKRLVLDPLRLDACYNWASCAPPQIARAIVLTAPDGTSVKDDLGGKPPPCPVQAAADGTCDLLRWVAGDNGALFAPQGGLRISARGLARVGRLLLGRGTIDGVRFLSPQSIDLIATPQWQYDGANGVTEHGFYCRFGLATQRIATRAAGCRDDPGLPAGDWWGHAGEAYGLRSGLWIDPAHGRGIAYFVTALGDTPAPGRGAFAAAEEAAAHKAVSLLPQR